MDLHQTLQTHSYLQDKYLYVESKGPILLGLFPFENLNSFCIDIKKIS